MRSGRLVSDLGQAKGQAWTAASRMALAGARRLAAWFKGFRAFLATVTVWLRRYGKIQHFYFALAAFDVAAVGAALYVAHCVNQVLSETVRTNLNWSELYGEANALNQAAGTVKLTGISAMSGSKADGGRHNFEEAVEQFQANLSRLRLHVQFLVPRQSNNDLGRALQRIEAAMSTMIARTRELLADQASGTVRPFDAIMDELSRAYSEVLGANAAIAYDLRRIETMMGQDALGNSRRLQQLEFVLGLMMILLVCCVTFYGHWLSRQFQERYREAEAANQKSMALAESLREANADVTHLNAELAASLENLRRAQEETIQKGKLAQLGELIATVAHEIRNPLGSARTALFLIERKVKDKNLGIDTQLQRVNNGIKRCDLIITELLDFTRSKSPQKKPTKLDDWVRTIVQEEAQALPPALTINYELGTGETEVAFDGGRMRRVLVNLLSNASEAMIGKGNDPAPVQIANPTITVRTRLAAGNAEITFADNGPGIAPENIKKILEPLFTTKSFGVGLGLPAVVKILEQHDGGLSIESQPGEGATMTAWFPAGPLPRAVAA